MWWEWVLEHLTFSSVDLMVCIHRCSLVPGPPKKRGEAWYTLPEYLCACENITQYHLQHPQILYEVLCSTFKEYFTR